MINDTQFNQQTVRNIGKLRVRDKKMKEKGEKVKRMKNIFLFHSHLKMYSSQFDSL